MTKKYDSNHIQVMSEIDHIRHAPGMYIGSTENPSKLLDEVLDNAIDELPFCKSGLEVIANYDENVYGIKDTGRGIPLGKIKLPDGTDNFVPVIIATKLFSSGKFKLDVYDIAAGVHGVGLVAVNALSDWLTIEIFRDNKHCIYYFENGEWIQEKFKCEKFDTSKITGTKIFFKPNSKYFESSKIPKSHIVNRLAVVKLYKDYEQKPLKLEIIENKQKLSIPIPKQLPDFFKSCFKTISVTQINPKTKESIQVFIGYDKKEFNSKSGGAVNVIPVNDGTHILFAKNQIKKAINALAKQQKRSIEQDDYQYGLRLYVLTKLRNRQFTSQSKEKLSTSSKYFQTTFGDELSNQIVKELKKSPKAIDMIFSKLESYRKYLSSKNILKTLKSDTKGKRTSRGLSDVPSLKDCLSPSTEDTELVIVEGESAGGTVLTTRDSNKMGVLLLKGKVINAEANKLERVLKNREVQALMKALGTGIGKDFDISKLRYSKIMIMTDADPDGGHITCLLLVVLSCLVPELLREGKVFAVNMPLYGVTHKKTNQFTPIWDKNEWLKYDDSNYYKHRYKGLGEMDDDEMKEILKVRHKIATPIILNDADMKILKSLMTSPKVKRDLLIEKGIIVE